MDDPSSLLPSFLFFSFLLFSFPFLFLFPTSSPHNGSKYCKWSEVTELIVPSYNHRQVTLR